MTRDALRRIIKGKSTLFIFYIYDIILIKCKTDSLKKKLRFVGNTFINKLPLQKSEVIMTLLLGSKVFGPKQNQKKKEI